MTDLLPCPFCGGEAKYYHRPDTTGWSNTEWVCCSGDCGASTCMQEAIAAWNTRSDDLVQAAVAAKLREAVEIYRKLSEGSPVGAADGQTYHVRYVTGDEFAQNILALIPQDAQAALDRVVAAERERIKGLVIIDEAGTVTPEMWDIAATLALIPNGEE